MANLFKSRLGKWFRSSTARFVLAFYSISNRLANLGSIFFPSRKLDGENTDNAQQKFVGYKIGPRKIAIICCLCIFVLIGLLKTSGNAKKIDDSKGGEVVRVSVPRQPGSFLLILAKKIDAFSKYGLSVQLDFQPTDKDAVNRLLLENADFAISYGTPIALSVIHGHKLQILAEMDRSVDSLVFFYRRANISTPEDLLGKRVAVSKGTNADYLLNIFLRMNNIDKKTLKIHNMLPSEAVEKLASGKIDAAVLWEPYVSLVQQKLGDRVAKFDTDFYTQISMLVKTSNKQYEYDRKTEALINGLADANEFYRKNKVAARNIVESELKMAIKDFSLNNWDNFEFELSLSQVLRNSLQDEINWYAKEVNLKPNKISHEVINAAYLKRIYPGSVTIE